MIILRLFSMACVLFLVKACAQPHQAPTLPAKAGVEALSPAQKDRIARQIWQNESGGRQSGLTAWNVGENFPSLGIGHFIWYPAGVRGPFTESFPSFIAYARARGIRPPSIALSASSPWQTRDEFLSKFQSAPMRELRGWFANNLEIQTDFIIAKSEAALPKMLQAASAKNRQRIARNYWKVASTPQGRYALIDYVNFKGEGTNPRERYAGQGWGLLQVLENMPEGGRGAAAARAFSQSAQNVLTRRIANAPPTRGEQRWRAGWMKRCKTYATPL